MYRRRSPSLCNYRLIDDSPTASSLQTVNSYVEDYDVKLVLALAQQL